METESIFRTLTTPDWFSIPIDLALAFLDYAGPDPTPSRTGQGEFGDYEYQTYWAAGRAYDVIYKRPVPVICSAVFLSQFTPELVLNAHGSYQIMLNWKIEPRIYRHSENIFGPDCYDSEDGYIGVIEGTYYVNFEYAD